MNDYNFGNFLCMLREQKGLTQAEIAQMLSVTPAAVSKWENGESKPRIETLFQLAEILDVTAEELMSGRFLRAEEPDNEQSEFIRKRYEYLTVINSLLTTNVRIKRIFANLIDWNLSGAPMLIVCMCVTEYVSSMQSVDSEADFFLALMMAMCIAVWMLLFVLRDFIFKGRSLGKRIFGLIVIDKNSGEKASKKQLALRNVFFFIEQIDGIIMLARGISLGDSFAQTLVVSKKQWEKLEMTGKGDAINGINAYEPSAFNSKKALLIVLSIVLAFTIFVGVVSGVVITSLNKVCETEQYALAVDYIIEHGKLEKLQTEADNLILKSYRVSTDYTSGTSQAKLGFVADGFIIEVICYKENEKWHVCEYCTESGMTQCAKHIG